MYYLPDCPCMLSSIIDFPSSKPTVSNYKCMMYVPKKQNVSVPRLTIDYWVKQHL